MKKLFLIALLVLLLILLFLNFTRRVSLISNTDLGRHLKNGELFYYNQYIPKTNFYSYTEPEKAVVNHHWASGLILYTIFKAFDYIGLSAFGFILLFVTFILFFTLSYQKPISEIVSITYIVLSILFLPLFSSRTDLRPELFSYLFTVLFLLIFSNYQKDRLSFQALLLFLLPLQILWSNLHVYYPLGILITLLSGIELLFNNKPGWTISKTVLLTILSVLVNIINVNGFSALTEPLLLNSRMVLKPAELNHVFGNDYFSLSSFPENYPYFLFLLLSIIVLSSILFLSFRKQLKQNFTITCLALITCLAAWYMQRNIALFAFCCLPLLIISLKELYGIWKSKMIRLTFFLSVILLPCLFSRSYLPDFRMMGFGQLKNESNAAEFIVNNRITGPVFNNYDIGGYLIWYCYPQLKVFIDSRPEAYSENFCRRIYWPVKRNDDNSFWVELQKNYSIQTIILSKTPEFIDNGFIEQRKQDKAWQLVFEDSYVVIFRKIK